VSHAPATLGCVVTPDLHPGQFLDVARAAETGGLDELWLWEDCLKQSAVATAGAILGATRRLSVGIGIMPAPLRNAALSAMDFATLAQMFPGRLVPGLGHGVQEWMGQVGARAASPLTLLEEHVVAVRSLLRGERVSHDGRYVTLRAAALGWPPAAQPPVYVGAVGPRTLRLAGAVGDGVIFALGTDPEELQAGLAIVSEARTAPRRDGAFGVCVYVGLSKAARLTGARATAEYLNRWVDAGATTIGVVPVDTDGEPEMSEVSETATWLGTSVRPALTALTRKPGSPTHTGPDGPSEGL
jgi:alkanesulfonate monooxygenase SsuD/methylene tetrahydromethanopterin reductase-like flavin-dependent oxidoreductase (luciferase family)